MPSALEMQLLCRSLSITELGVAEDRWRESLLPSLVGNDIALASHVCDFSSGEG